MKFSKDKQFFLKFKRYKDRVCNKNYPLTIAKDINNDIYLSIIL